MSKANYCNPGIIAALVLAGTLSTPALAADQNNTVPHLRKQGTATQLVVDGRPFLILGGELHNSSSSSPEYMKPIWPKLADANLNTVLAVVSWELLEPEEGKFDFSLVDDLIKEARRYNLRLVLLWFGSWKNGVSTYVPVWVKTDLNRFPRARDQNDTALDILSTFSDAAIDADARAFAALMRHIREVDGQQHTVIMMQVENEVGVLGDSRDRCPAANDAYKKPVPKELTDYLRKHKDSLLPDVCDAWQAAGSKTSGTWEEIFGANKPHEHNWRKRSFFTDEIFMAWQYARYVGRIIEAGKAEYPIPMFVNAWLDQDGFPQPGEFPSGGPLAHVMDIWRAGAPQVDMLCPDIYAPNFEERCELYSRSGNPLFIPEARRERRDAVNVFYAIGRHDAIGFSPFGIETAAEPNNELAKCYGVLSRVAPFILENQGRGAIAGVVLDGSNQTEKLQLAGYTLEFNLAKQWSSAAPQYAAGIIIAVGPDEFLAAGRGLTISFSPNTPGPAIVGLATIEEGTFVDGRWMPGRRLNGDETSSGKGLRFSNDGYGIQKVKLYRYQ